MCKNESSIGDTISALAFIIFMIALIVGFAFSCGKKPDLPKCPDGYIGVYVSKNSISGSSGYIDKDILDKVDSMSGTIRIYYNVDLTSYFVVDLANMRDISVWYDVEGNR